MKLGILSMPSHVAAMAKPYDIELFVRRIIFMVRVDWSRSTAFGAFLGTNKLACSDGILDRFFRCLSFWWRWASSAAFEIDSKRSFFRRSSRIGSSNFISMFGEILFVVVLGVGLDFLLVLPSVFLAPFCLPLFISLNIV